MSSATPKKAFRIWSWKWLVLFITCGLNAAIHNPSSCYAIWQPTLIADKVYYIKAVPWLGPGFSVKSHLKDRLKLQSQLEHGKRLAFVANKYLIESRKMELS